jgi:hypothetical protein
MKRNLHNSQFGAKFLQECFSQAKDDELNAIEASILNRTKEMAMGQYRSVHVQCVPCNCKYYRFIVTEILT